MRSAKIISVIIPLFNEEKRFAKSFPKIESFFGSKKLSLEYIFIDDGSTDKTFRLIQNLKSKYPIRIIRNKTNLGKGASLKRGVEQSNGRYILFSDADLSTPIEEFNKLFPYLKKYDMVVGSRRLHNSDVVVSQPFHRKILGEVFYFLFSAFFTKTIKDTNCGFKLYRSEVAKKIYHNSRNSGWGFDAEVIYLALKYGYKIAEVPVIWLNDPFSRVSTIRASVETLKELAMIKFNDWTGVYDETNIIQRIAKIGVSICFKILFSVLGKPKTSKGLDRTISLYKVQGFPEIFNQIRVWDTPFEIINKHLPKKGKILDLGSGDGLLANYLALESNLRKVYGYEINRDRLNISDQGVPNTEFLYGDLTKLKLPKAECMLLVHVLHHLPSKKEQEKLLSRCFSNINKSGRLVVVEIAQRPIIKYLITWLTDAFVVPMLFEKKIFSSQFFYRSTTDWQELLSSVGFKTKVYSAHRGRPFSHVIFVATKI